MAYHPQLYLCMFCVRPVLSALTAPEHIYTTIKTNNRAALCTQLLPFILPHIDDLVCQPRHMEHIHHATGGTRDSRSTPTEEWRGD